ncbi:hypothetical protein GCM10027081_07590 [Cupriavidus yeoncheonensis]
MANWKGIIYQLFHMGRHITGLEGKNGAGKTTSMAAFLTAIVPNLRLLVFPNIGATGERNPSDDDGLWGRLSDDGTAFSIIEWVLPNGKSVWAGVALVRKARPSVDINKMFLIQDLPRGTHPDSAFLVKKDGNLTVPTFAAMRENLTMLGARMVVYSTLTEYLRALFDHGITPMPMSTYQEQERFYRVLASSMAGTSLGEIAKSKLRDFLLSEDRTLVHVITKMRECLEDCQRTRRDIESTQEKHDEIHGLFDAAWNMVSLTYFGALARFEQIREAWQHQSRQTRALKTQRAEHEAKFADLKENEHRLTQKEQEDGAVLEDRRTDYAAVCSAISLRARKDAAYEALQDAMAKHEVARRARVEAEERQAQARNEEKAARADDKAISDEMADLNRAIESLNGRVTRLQAARRALANARAIVGHHANEKNADALKAQSDAPMATPNCSTYGRSNCSRQDGQIMTVQA